MKSKIVSLISSGICGPMLLCAALVLLAASGRAASAPPDRMTYQGYLVNNSGDPLSPTTPANYPVIFRIYDASEAGNLLWAEQQIVTVDKGNFSVILGEGTEVTGEAHGALSSVFLGATGSERYIAITVTVSGSTLTLLPRVRLLPAPYAFLATQAVQLVNPSSGVPFLSLNAGEATISGNSRVGGTLFWGSAGALSGTQGGSLELGDSLAATATPFIDFHYGKNGLFQDYNVRLINDGDGRLSLYGGRLSFGNNVADTKIALWENGGAPYGLGIGASQFRLHLDTSASRFSFLNAPNGSEIMTIRGGGNVGINASNPGHKLEVHGSDNVAWFESAGANAYLRVSDNTGFDNRVEFASRGYGRAAIWSGDDHLNVLRNGRVGIGTTTPAYLLTMNTHGDNSQARIRIESGTKYFEMGRVDNYAFLQLNESYWSAGNRIVTYDGDSNWDFSSDRKLKKDITDAESMLDRALKVQVRRYRWKDEGSDAKHKLGVIAQEVQPLFPEMVSAIHPPNDPTDTVLSVGYGDFGLIAIKAIQELNTVLETKDARISALEGEIAALKQQIAAAKDADMGLQARFTALEKLVAGIAQPQNATATNKELANRQP